MVRCASRAWRESARYDDSNPEINPLATEVCDGADNDCDGAIDEGGVCATCPCATAYDQVIFNATFDLICTDNATQTVLDQSPDFISMLHAPVASGLPRCTAVDLVPPGGVNVEIAGVTPAEDAACSNLIRLRAAALAVPCG